jgi:hypothetical protein
MFFKYELSVYAKLKLHTLTGSLKKIIWDVKMIIRDVRKTNVNLNDCLVEMLNYLLSGLTNVVHQFDLGVLLGRIIPENGEQAKEQKADYLCDGKSCTLIEGEKKNPQYRFTLFEIPQDGSAVAVDECTIHNDSFCNGKQVVFIADTAAITVALRETSPFKNIRTEQVNPPVN